MLRALFKVCAPLFKGQHGRPTSRLVNGSDRWIKIFLLIHCCLTVDGRLKTRLRFLKNIGKIAGVSSWDTVYLIAVCVSAFSGEGIKMATKFGGTGADKIAGTSKDDFLFGGGGADTIVSGAGDDAVWGGLGNDSLQLGAGDDIASGGAGNDIMSGGDNNDILLGGAGDDIISGDNGDDIIGGGSGIDTFQFKTGFGHDTILDYTDGDRIQFYIGSVIGETHNLTFTSSADFLSYASSHGLGITQTGFSDVTVSGFANGASVTLVGLGTGTGVKPPATSGDDTLLADGAGHMVGGGGNDTIYDGGPLALVEGNAGDDVLIGGSGNDKIGAQTGDDFIFAGAGNDVVTGGVGNDIVTGDEGADVFQFSAGEIGNNDVITDLNFAEGDKIDFFAGTFAGQGSNIQVSNINELVAVVTQFGSADVTNETVSDTLVLHFGAGQQLTLVGLAAEWHAVTGA